jgi:membrane-associated phospholipid phosphatase
VNKGLFKNNLFFLLPYFLFLIAGAFLLFTFPKARLHLLFNVHHSLFFNTVFYYLTFLGDGWTAVLISLVLLFLRFRYALILLLSFGLSSAITQSLKHFIFDEHIRPSKFFEGDAHLYLVPGVDMNSYYSFPSGHTTTAFAVYLCLALFVPGRWAKLGLFLLTVIVAWSRVYLSQHFFEDIYSGSIVGVVSALTIYSLLADYKPGGWLDGAVIGGR